MNQLVNKYYNGIRQRWVHFFANRRWQTLTKRITRQGKPLPEVRPVIFFNASTRLQSMSQNAAYSMITALGIQLQDVPVIQFVCEGGMSRCVLGSRKEDFSVQPPCKRCKAQSRQVFKGMNVVSFEYDDDEQLKNFLEGLDVSELEKFTFQGQPLGFWSVNSLRWVLRRHHLIDDENTRSFFQFFILSAWNVYRQFSLLIENENPQAVVVFNGMFFPEAAARQAALDHSVRVITHEVGLRPFSGFFTTGEATAYPMQINEDFTLSNKMNPVLDEYLAKRFQGDFSMAGIRFWADIQGLSEELLAKMAGYKKIVPVFTNVIFDTSQVHANTIFDNMFEWLNDLHEVSRAHPEILFFIRAHPDESRRGKESLESVADWVRTTGIDQQPNVLFVDSGEYLSSYELIQKSHLVLVYNSTIGLEASLMGKPVLASGKARFTQLPISFYPGSNKEYRNRLEEMLNSETIPVPPEFQVNARRFLYFQLYKTSLNFDQFLEEDGVWNGYVKPRAFPLEALLPENSSTIKVLIDGILKKGDFIYPA